MALPAKKSDLVLPTHKEVHLAEESSRVLSAYMGSTKSPNIQLVDDKGHKKSLTLPPVALRLLVDLLTEMGEGNAVALMPIHAELTTQEAADLLNVSRPYLVALLDNDEIPHRKVGSKRRVLAKDVLQYKSEIEHKRRKVLDELAQKSQELKMGYE